MTDIHAGGAEGSASDEAAVAADLAERAPAIGEAVTIMKGHQ
jgi:hypothetical protein